MSAKGKGFIVFDESSRLGQKEAKKNVEKRLKSVLEGNPLYGMWFASAKEASAWKSKKVQEFKGSFYKGFKHFVDVIPVESCDSEGECTWSGNVYKNIVLSEETKNKIQNRIDPVKQAEEAKRREKELADSKQKKYSYNTRNGIAVLPYKADVSFWGGKGLVYNLGGYLVYGSGENPEGEKENILSYGNFAFHDQHPTRVLFNFTPEEVEVKTVEDALKCWGHTETKSYNFGREIVKTRKLNMYGCLK